MPKTKISEFSATPANNTDIDSINIAEGCAPSGINDAIRELMSQLKDFQTGAVGDSFNGPVGTTTAAAGAFTTLSATGNVTLGDASTDTLNVGNGGLIKDASGNLGLGVTPSAWASSHKIAQVGSNSSFGNSTSGTYIGNNWLYDGANKYLTGTNFGALYGQNAGEHQWYNAPSGTAGSAMTLTQAMTLSVSGRLGIGTTSPDAGAKLTVAGGILTTGAFSATTGSTGGIDYSTGSLRYFSMGTSGATKGAYTWIAKGADDSSSTPMTLDSGGNLLVGTTTLTSRLAVSGSTEIGRFQNTSGTGNVRFVNSSDSTIGYIQWSGSTTSYVTSSDYRLKNTIAPMTGALAKVALLKPVTYKWNTDGANGQGFIAHELAEVVPECVTGAKDGIEIYTDEDGNEQTRPKYQGIDTSFLVATLTAAIQEQQAIIESLKARLDAANL